MATTAYLVSAAVGDRAEGTDIALLDDVEALRDPAVTSWMQAQGYGPADPGECMYLSEEPPPAGWESLRLELDDADAARWARARQPG